MTEYGTRVAENLEGFAQYDLDRDSDEAVEQRLAVLRELNAEFERDSDFRRLESYDGARGTRGSRTLTYEKTYALFGAILGIFPPAAFFLRFLLGSKSETWLAGAGLIVIIVAAIVGYFTGKAVGRVLENVESGSWWSQLLLVPVVGLVWGIITGMASGVIIFIVGALFGGVIGGLVGAAALPAFYLLQKLLIDGNSARADRILPLGLGVALVISGIIFRL